MALKALLISFLFASGLSALEKPNILFLLADDMSQRDLNAFTDLKPNPNPAIAPNLDSLASNGLRFTRMHSHPMCTTTRVSIMTGMNPNAFGLGTVLESNPSIDLDLPFTSVTLPEVLKTLGYSTAAFGKWHMSVNDGLDAPRLHGFDTFRAGSLMNLSPLETYFNWSRIDDGVATPTTEYNTEAIGDAVIDWMSEQTDNQPWFGYVAFHAPHGPFHTPPAHLLPVYSGVSPTNPNKNRKNYDLMIQSLDTVIGNVLANVPDNTMVFFMSDNGTPQAAVLPSQSPRKVKQSAHRDGIEVPFIAWSTDGVFDVGDYHGLAQSSDLFATFIGLADTNALLIAPNTSLSFEPSLREKNYNYGRANAFSEFFSDNGQQPPEKVSRAVTAHRYKYLQRRTLAGGQQIYESFYDLADDPNENSNLLTGSLSPKVLDHFLRLKRFMSKSL